MIYNVFVSYCHFSDPYTTYNVSVAAHTKIGMGRFRATTCDTKEAGKNWKSWLSAHLLLSCTVLHCAVLCYTVL